MGKSVGFGDTKYRDFSKYFLWQEITGLCTGGAGKLIVGSV